MLLKNYTHSASTALVILDDFGAEILLEAIGLIIDAS